MSSGPMLARSATAASEEEHRQMLAVGGAGAMARSFLLVAMVAHLVDIGLGEIHLLAQMGEVSRDVLVEGELCLDVLVDGALTRAHVLDRRLEQGLDMSPTDLAMAWRI